MSDYITDHEIAHRELMKKCSEWNLGRNTALIQSLEDFARHRPCLSGAVIMTSGGFDPIHPGHMTSFLDSKREFVERADATNGPWPTLVVVVNGDGFLRKKKGRAFMDLRTRCQIVSCCRGVDIVIPYEPLNDDTVIEAIRAIRPDAFTKGGDRTDLCNIPEWDICEEFKVEIVTGMGEDKVWSSSDFLKEWELDAWNLYRNSL